MTLIERYMNSHYKNEYMASLRDGYIEWKGGKWVTNLCGFIRLRNPALKVNKCSNPAGIGFDNFMHKDLRFNEIQDSLTLLEGNGVIEYKLNDESIRVNNKVFKLMCRINNRDKFRYILRGRHALYLYDDELELQGLVLGVR
jgi:hypothetical protein